MMTSAAPDIGNPTLPPIKAAMLMTMACQNGAASNQPDPHCDALGLYALPIADLRLPDVRREKPLAVIPAPPANRPQIGRQIRQALHRANELGLTHLITFAMPPAPATSDVARLIDAIRTQPGSVIIGGRFSGDREGVLKPTFADRLARFWLRIQTGLSIKDPLSNIRVYPLQITAGLKLKRDSLIVISEVLVKAAWAGIPISEVVLTASSRGVTQHQASRRRRCWEAPAQLLLNIHWTLRSITPIPHRKIVTDPTQAGKAVSVWHPIKSIRTLLTENLSPKQLAAASALGVFFGTLPLIACHSVAILFGASYFRLNKIAALTASQICMPPIVPALCIEIGHFMRHGAFLTELSLETLGYQALDRLWEWLLGAMVLAPLLAVVVGALVFVIAASLAAESN